MTIGRCAPLAAVVVSVSLAWASPAPADDAHALAQKFAAGAEQEEAKRKAEDAKRKAEDAKRKADEEKRKAEEKKRKAAAEAKRKADEEMVRLALEEAEMLERAQREADERKAALDKARAEEEAREAQREQEQRLTAQREAAERAEKASRLAEQQRIAREQFIAEQQRLAEEQRRAEEERLAAEKRAAEERRLSEERRIAEEKRIAEQKRAEDERLAAEKQAADERRIAEEKRSVEQKRVQQEERRLAEERRKLAEEKQRLADEQRALEAQRKALAAEREAEHQRLKEKLAKREEERKAGERIGDNSPMGLGVKPPAAQPSVAKAAPATTRVTVLLVMDPGTNGIRRYGRKVADPVLCAGATCWIGAGIDRTAAVRTRGQALGPGNTLGHRAAACNQRLACAFRDIDLKTRPATVQPIDLRIMRHDRREFLAIEADPSCRLTGGTLTCDKTYTARTWRAWVVPEMLAAEAGPAVLEKALASGLARPSATLIPAGL